jgi:hypothetical protein
LGRDGLVWLGEPKVAVQVAGDAIVVTLPGASFQVTYKRQQGSLVASGYSIEPRRDVTESEFFAKPYRLDDTKPVCVDTSS